MSENPQPMESLSWTDVPENQRPYIGFSDGMDLEQWSMAESVRELERRLAECAGAVEDTDKFQPELVTIVNGAIKAEGAPIPNEITVARAEDAPRVASELASGWADFALSLKGENTRLVWRARPQFNVKYGWPATTMCLRGRLAWLP